VWIKIIRNYLCQAGIALSHFIISRKKLFFFFFHFLALFIYIIYNSKLDMKVVIQRVARSVVTIDSRAKSAINVGLLVLIGVEDADNDEDIKWLSNKIVNLRIFDDENKVPNLSVKDINGDILLVSQFTLQASTKKGNRPSYLVSARKR